MVPPCIHSCSYIFTREHIFHAPFDGGLSYGFHFLCFHVDLCEIDDSVNIGMGCSAASIEGQRVCTLCYAQYLKSHLENSDASIPPPPPIVLDNDNEQEDDEPPLNSPSASTPLLDSKEQFSSEAAAAIDDSKTEFKNFSLPTKSSIVESKVNQKVQMLLEDSSASFGKKLASRDPVNFWSEKDLDVARNIQDKNTNQYHAACLKYLIMQSILAVVPIIPETSKLISIEIAQSWTEVIYDLIFDVIFQRFRQLVGQVSLNASQWLKIKRIPGGSHKDSFILDGILFTKSVRDKKMLSAIQNGKILLVDSPLDYLESPSPHMTSSEQILGSNSSFKWHVDLVSMQVMISEKKDFLFSLASKIKSLEPDLVISTSYICGELREVLQSKNVVCLQNVKRSVFDRISKFTGAGVITIYDILPRISSLSPNNRVGFFNKFEVLRVNTASSSEPSKKIASYVKLELDWDKEISPMFTICLRGASKKSLKLFKTIVQKYLKNAANMLLEQSLLRDKFSMIPVFKPDEEKYENSREANNDSSMEEFHDLGFYSPINSPHIVVYGWTRIRTNFSAGQCFHSRIFRSEMYGKDDLALGDFIFKRLITPALKKSLCKICGTLLSDHLIVLSHGKGRVKIDLQKLPYDLLEDSPRTLTMWSSCLICDKRITPVTEMSLPTYFMSFTRFLQLITQANSSSNQDSAICFSRGCSHGGFTKQVQYFNYRQTIVSFSFEEITPFELKTATISSPSQSFLRDYQAELFKTAEKLFVGVSHEVSNLTKSHLDRLESLALALQKQINVDQHSFQTKFSELKERSPYFLEILQLYRFLLQLCDKWMLIFQEFSLSFPALGISGGQSPMDASVVMEQKDPEIRTSSQFSRMVRRMSEVRPSIPFSDPVPETDEMYGFSDSSSFSKARASVTSLLNLRNLILPNNFSVLCDWNTPWSVDPSITVPIHPQRPNTIISHVLSSAEYLAALNQISLETIVSKMPIFKDALSLFALDSKAGPDELRAWMMSSSQQRYDQEMKLPENRGRGCSVRMYYPRQFHALRHLVCGSNFDFINSIWDVLDWRTDGGKSSAKFCKTRDQKFVIKYVSQRESSMFKDMALEYFRYIGGSYLDSLPCSLIPILGLFKVSWNTNSQTGLAKEQSLGAASGTGTISSGSTDPSIQTERFVIMPNLMYGQKLTQVFDLKGKTAGRFVTPANNNAAGASSVLLDKNFIHYTQGLPLPLKSTSRSWLREALERDAGFLASMDIMDYSILVGLNDAAGEDRVLIVGIIDYIHQYTFNKKLENRLKSVFAKGDPTVVHPEKYKKRFLEAMRTYFLL
jgi:hypothetical protein